MKTEQTANLELLARADAVAAERARWAQVLARPANRRPMAQRRADARRAALINKAGDILAGALVTGGLLALALAYFDILAA